MADIFISYASEDHDRVQPLVDTFEAEGWSVWWDRAIRPGTNYDDMIDRAILDARCVVVVWTETSIASDWVRTESLEGMERNILVPVLLDEVRIPLAFRRIQAARLVGWPAKEASEFGLMMHGVAAMLGEELKQDPENAPPKARETAAPTMSPPAPATSPTPAVPPAEPAPPVASPDRRNAVSRLLYVGAPVLLAGAIAFWATGVLDGDSAFEECRRLAAPNEAEGAPGAGAVAACREALEAAADDPERQFLLGRALVADGLHGEAARLYQRASDQGFAIAQSNLGVLYRDGDGVARDHAEALRLFHLAADQGHARAQAHIGNMYENGFGVPRSIDEATRYYGLGADQGDAWAAERLEALTGKS